MMTSLLQNEPAPPASDSAAPLALKAIALGSSATLLGGILTGLSLVALLAVLEPHGSDADDRLALAIPSVRMAMWFMSLAWAFLGGVVAGTLSPPSEVQNAAAAGALTLVPAFVACVPFNETVMSTIGALLIVPTAACGGWCARFARPH